MKPFALALLTALLSAAVHPGLGFSWLAPVCLVPLLLAIEAETSAKRRLVLGLVAGFGYWCGVCYWISNVLANFAAMSLPLVGLAFFLFAVLRSVHWMLFSVFAGYGIESRWAMVSLAALWTGLERVYGPFGFAWLVLGNAGVDMGVPLRLAPITGVYGLSFVFAMMNVAVVLLILKRPRRHLMPMLVLPLLYLLPALPEAEKGTEFAVVTQPNIVEREDWPAGAADDTIRRVALQTIDVGYRQTIPARMLLWPEVPAPFYEQNEALREQVSDLAKTMKAPLLMGVVAFTPLHEPLNSIMSVTAEGNFGPRYDKMNLVPFGEQTPAMFEWVGKVSSEAGSFHPGNAIQVFDVTGGKAGAFICYESVFPHFVRQIADKGATVLVNLSNDGYFGKSAAREQHLSIVRMRAAENRRWLVRATNDGITATIDPAGRITHRLEPYASVVARTQFGYVSEKTLYTRYGDWFVWTCLVGGLLHCAIRYRA